jgi:HAD superfamily hydrolase (TIGR01509 family)
MFRGVIFDFNGVLLWDTRLQEQAWAQFALTLRPELFGPEEMRTHMHGRPNRAVLEHLAGRALTLEETARLTDAKEAHYRELCLAQGDAFALSPGACELLNWLVAQGVPCAIATSSERTNVAFFTRHLGLEAWFATQQIVYDDGSLPGKPAPDIYLRAAARLGLPPEGCIVVEDAPSGIAAAHAAGIGHIIAVGPAEQHHRLRELSGVAQVIPSLAEFPRDLLAASHEKGLEHP